MDFEFYCHKFRKAAERLDKIQLNKKQLEASVGIVLDSVFLKLYKREWTSDLNNPLNAEARIFFSVWVNDKTIQENKIYYNIHALKLRKLKGHSVLSREFADRYRKHFKKYKTNWENVNINLGPLTLMEGWKELSAENLERIIVKLADDFSEIDHLIDETLKAFKN
jgi:hypothetical protein